MNGEDRQQPVPLRTPDVTPAQGGSVAVLAGSIATVASGVIDSETIQGLVAGLGALVSAVWMVVDQRMRAARVAHLAAPMMGIAAARAGRLRPQYATAAGPSPGEWPEETVRTMVEPEPDVAYLIDDEPVPEPDDEDDPYAMIPEEEPR